MIQHFSTTYERRPDGSLVFRAATLDGQVFAMHLSPEEALDNLQAFAHVLGLVVAKPL